MASGGSGAWIAAVSRGDEGPLSSSSSWARHRFFGSLGTPRAPRGEAEQALLPQALPCSL